MLFAGGFGVFPRSPSMRREWIEILRIPDKRNKFPRLPPCGGSGLKYFHVEICEAKDTSPSMRREWIEMNCGQSAVVVGKVSLHAEGVD